MNRYMLCAASVVFIAAGMGQAQDRSLPSAEETAPAPAKTEPAPAASGLLVGPAVPVPTCYPDAPCTARRHPLLLWLTYVPSRRPYFDGHICQKAPNIQPPLYDFFPCTGEGCYSCGTTTPYYPCNGKFCKGRSCAARGAP